MTFDARYRELFADLERVCRALGAGAEAEDVAQESILAGRAQLHQLRDDAKLLPWLRRIAVRAVYAGQRAAEQRGRLSHDAAAGTWQSDSFPMAELASDELAALRQLPPRERQYVTLVYFAGYRQDEVAEMVAVSRGAVAKTLWKARVRLAHLLAEYV